jgi:hypothetical protein
MAKRVYFAFHYQDVIDFRANVVRNHRLIGGAEKAGYFDASIWEEARKKNPLALKRMINTELENTSVTVVLIGSDTYARPWVRYEIFKSIERGNSLIGIHINSVKGKDQKTKPLGPNPFDYLGLIISNDGKRGTPREWDSQKWIDFAELGTFGIYEQPVDKRGKGFKLSHWLTVYDWVADDGYQNFNSWIS